MAKKKKNPNNPHVTISLCNERYGLLDTKITEILYLLKGNPRSHKDLGIMGELQNIQRDKRWVYGLITLIGIPVFFLLLQYLSI